MTDWHASHVSDAELMEREEVRARRVYLPMPPHHHTFEPYFGDAYPVAQGFQCVSFNPRCELRDGCKRRVISESEMQDIRRAAWST